MPHEFPAPDAPAFRAALLAWYRRNARKLPWREKPSLYRTVVSEFMLQQTQVVTVLPYFERWMRAFPDFRVLAAASEEAVLKQWEGLGYYSRARNLHRLAKELAGRAEAPRTPEEWRRLPGIGPYTAAAVTSIAFGHPAACVDGNVVRIVARLVGDDRLYRDGATAAKALTPLAGQLLSRDEPGDHNQAMMELGATLCTRKNPPCLLCPVTRFCAAGRAGNAEAIPRLAPKAIERREVTRIWCERRGELLLHRAAASAPRLAGLHELPTAEQLGLSAEQARKGRRLAAKTRSITRFRIAESIHALPASKVPGASRSKADSQLVWVPLARLGEIPLSGPHRRWIGEILANRPPSRGAR